MCILFLLLHKFFIIKDVACTFALTALSPTSGIRAFEVLQPLAYRHQLAYNISVLVFVQNREENVIHRAASHRCREENRPQAKTVYSVREPALTRVHALCCIVVR